MRFCEETQQNIHKHVYEIIRQQRKVVLHVYHKPMERFVDTMKKRSQRKEGTVTKRFNGEKDPLRKGFNGKKEPLRKETGLYDEIGEQPQPPTQFVQTS